MELIHPHVFAPTLKMLRDGTYTSTCTVRN